MRYVNSTREVQVFHAPQQSLGLGQTPPSPPVSTPSLWLLGAIGLGLYLFASADASKSKWF